MKADVDRLVQRVSTVRFDFPSALVVFYADIDRSVGIERKYVADIDIPEDLRASLKHLTRCQRLHYRPEVRDDDTHHINETYGGDYGLPVYDVLSQVGECLRVHLQNQ